MKNYRYLITVLALAIGFTACKKEEPKLPDSYEKIVVAERPNDVFGGVYVLNEGPMGQNKSSLDFLCFQKGVYIHDIYADRNPYQVKELGDVGNDLLVYGSKLYIVLNQSHKVEVVNAYGATRIGKVDIPNGRYAMGNGKYVYISSYSQAEMGKKEALGKIYRIDTASLQISGEIEVGYQPEQMVIRDGKLYVANSGGYMTPNYDKTVSVINLATFKEEKKIDVAVNLDKMLLDGANNIWISSRGNYADISSSLYVLTPQEEVIPVPVGCSNMAIYGNKLYYISSVWNNEAKAMTYQYGVINTQTRQKEAENFIPAEYIAKIKAPYGLAIHPKTGDIYVTDADNFVAQGKLYTFSQKGELLWEVTAGFVPAHFAFLPKR